MKPTRDGYGEGLVALGETHSNVVVLCADLTESTRAQWFKEKYPDRFFSVGIAEQNMFSTAAGLALSGKIPYASTFGVFASGRAWEQIRTSIAYMNLNVKIGGSHGGVSVGPDGATHQALEEIALMRVLPNMTVIVPADACQAKAATIAASDWPGPVYFRLSRSKSPIVCNDVSKFKIGKAIRIVDGSDVSIVACGLLVEAALKASIDLKQQGISARVIDLHTIKPIDEKELLEAAMQTKAIVTAEEHSIIGGLGGAVSEFLSRSCPVPMKMVGVNDVFGESGTADELMKYYGLTSEAIVKSCIEVIKLKKK